MKSTNQPSNQPPLHATRELANHLDKAQEDMSPLRVYELFKKITDEDAVVLWLNPKCVSKRECERAALPDPTRLALWFSVTCGRTDSD